MLGALTGRNGRGINVYFVANFSDKIISVGTWNDGDVNMNTVSTTGARCGAFAGNYSLVNQCIAMHKCFTEFDKSLLSVTMTTSISFVSIDQVSVMPVSSLMCSYYLLCRLKQIKLVIYKIVGQHQGTTFGTALHFHNLNGMTY